MATSEEPIGIVELEENLADIEKPPELPNGTYNAEIQDVQNAVSTSGNAYWPLRLRIPPNEIPADMAEFFEDGVLLSYNRLMHPKDRRQMYNLRKFLEAIDLPTNVTTVDPNEWMGRECRVVVRQSLYQGEMRAGIVSIEASESAPKAAPAKRSRR